MSKPKTTPRKISIGRYQKPGGPFATRSMPTSWLTVSAAIRNCTLKPRLGLADYLLDLNGRAGGVVTRSGKQQKSRFDAQSLAEQGNLSSGWFYNRDKASLDIFWFRDESREIL
jgi:hypothetical protein